MTQADIFNLFTDNIKSAVIFVAVFFVVAVLIRAATKE